VVRTGHGVPVYGSAIRDPWCPDLAWVLHPHQASGMVATPKTMGQPWHDNPAARFAGTPLPSPVL